VRHTALPARGDLEQLGTLVGRELSSRLDRSRPLWEVTVIDGLGHRRVAVLAKLHHALVDGIAALALGALHDVESIPILIQAFEGGSPEGARAASEALTRITLQRLGPNPQKWLRWWKENRGHSRAEWLFAALTSEEADLRGAAADELRAAGAPPVHYSADLPASELAAAARAWWTWWSHQGLKV
jgi:hypothetical protein